MKIAIMIDSVSLEMSYIGQHPSDVDGMSSKYGVSHVGRRGAVTFPDQRRLDALGLKYLGRRVKVTKVNDYSLWFRMKPGASRGQKVVFFAALAVSTKKE